MSYLDLILRFWQLDKQHCFSSEETRLYFYLLDVANDHKPAWPDSFERADPKTAADNRMAVNTMKKWRNRLEQVGLISVQPGGKGQGSRVRYQLRCQILTPKEAVRCQVSYQNLTPKADQKPALVSSKVSNFDTYSLYTRIKTFFYIAIDADKVSNFDTYVRSKKSQTPPPSGAPPNLFDSDDWPARIKVDRVFQETAYKNLKLTGSRLNDLIDEFAGEQAALEQSHSNFKDFKKHCYNWLRIQSEKSQRHGTSKNTPDVPALGQGASLPPGSAYRAQSFGRRNQSRDGVSG